MLLGFKSGSSIILKSRVLSASGSRYLEPVEVNQIFLFFRLFLRADMTGFFSRVISPCSRKMGSKYVAGIIIWRSSPLVTNYCSHSSNPSPYFKTVIILKSIHLTILVPPHRTIFYPSLPLIYNSFRMCLRQTRLTYTIKVWNRLQSSIRVKGGE